jgi:hypothetical protein
VGRIAWSVVAALCYVGAVVGLAASVRDNWRWLREGQQVDAVVVDRADDDWYTVEYHGTVIVEGDMWGGEWETGDSIRVFVHPDDPSRVRNSSSLWLELLLGVPITAGVVVGAPPIVYWWIWKRRPRERRCLIDASPARTRVSQRFRNRARSCARVTCRQPEITGK